MVDNFNILNYGNMFKQINQSIKHIKMSYYSSVFS